VFKFILISYTNANNSRTDEITVLLMAVLSTLSNKLLIRNALLGNPVVCRISVYHRSPSWADANREFEPLIV